MRGEIVPIEDYPLTSRKKWIRGLSVSSVSIVNLASAFFMFITLSFLEEELKIDNPVFLLLYKILSVAFCASITTCDVIVANPIEMSSSIMENEDKIKNEEAPTSIDNVANCFSRTNIALNTIGYNLLNAGSLALPITYVTTNPAIRYTVGIPLTLLGSTFLHILLTSRVKEHSYKFAKRFLNCHDSILLDILKSPACSSEVIIQSLSSAIYLGVGSGFIIDEIFRQYFNHASNFPYIVAAFMTTIYLTFFSRTLNVYREFFDSKLDFFNKRNHLSISKMNFLVDMLFISSRVVFLNIFLNSRLPFSLPGKISIMAITSFLTITQGAVSRYKRRQYKVLLDGLSSNRSERNLLKPLSADEKRPEALFNLIKEMNKSKKIIASVTVLNTLARTGKSLSFLVFLFRINKSLNLGLNTLDVVSLHQLWGNSCVENEWSFYQSSLIDNMTYWVSKFNLYKINAYGREVFFKSVREINPVRLTRYIEDTLSDGVQLV